MRTPPPGQHGRHTVMMRVSIPVWLVIAARQEDILARTSRVISMAEALEQIIAETGEPGMTLKIDDDKITSPDSHHQAVRLNGAQWEVSWFPDQRLSRNQAVTAMMIAAVVGASDDKITHADPMWPRLNAWAHEIGLDGDGAISYAMRPVSGVPFKSGKV